MRESTIKSNQNKIKVVHLSSAHGDRDVRIFLKECASLASYQKGEKYEVHQVLAGVEEREELGIHIHTVKKYPNQRLKRMWTTVNDVYKKAISLNADIYHLHDPELLRIALKLKRKGKIVIYDAHEDLPRQILGKGYLKFKGLISKVVECYENFVTKRLDGIVTATPFIRDRFIKINPNTVDINNFPLLSEIDFDGGSNKKENSICFIGNISPIRGLSQVIEALNNVNINFYIAGELDASYRDELSKIKGWEKVIELGFIDRVQSKELKNKSIAGIVTFLPLPNHINAQPNKIFEYMASELPVIGSNFPLWKEIIEKNNCGICVNPLNPSEIANAIQQLIDSPEIAIRMGKNGKQLVQSTYNWDIEKEKLYLFYNSIYKK
jgi:glycosyltransferase involved in cell wall biosynthesis